VDVCAYKDNLPVVHFYRWKFRIRGCPLRRMQPVNPSAK
jgi:hypothetical protein